MAIAGQHETAPGGLAGQHAVVVVVAVSSLLLLAVFFCLGDGGNALSIDVQTLAVIILTIAIVVSIDIIKSCPICILEHLAALPLLG